MLRPHLLASLGLAALLSSQASLAESRQLPSELGQLQIETVAEGWPTLGSPDCP